MIEYLYSLDYNLKDYNDCLHIIREGSTPADISKLRNLTTHQLLRNASMYSIGEKYGIHGLKGIASEKFAAILQQPPSLVDGKFVHHLCCSFLQSN